MGNARDQGDNVANIGGLAGPTVEGAWRGGLPGGIGGGGGRGIANAEMLERFAGVSGGGQVASEVGGSLGNVPRVTGAPNGGGINALGALGTAGSIYGLGTGIHDMIYGNGFGERAMGGVNTVLGGIGTVGGIANMANVGMAAAGSTGALATAQNVIAGMTSMGGSGIGGMGLAGEVGAASTWFGTAAGGAGAGTAAGVGTALTTGAGVIGAGLAGYGLGSYGDAHMAETGLLGGKSISDWGGDLAASADENVTNFVGGEQGSIRRSIGGALGTTAGLGTVLGTSVLGVPMAIGSAAHGAVSAAGDLAGWAGNGIANMAGRGLGAATDMFMNAGSMFGPPMPRGW